MPKTTKNAANFAERKANAMYAKVNIWQARTARLCFILMCCVMPIYLNQHRYMGLPQHKWEFFVTSMVVIFLCIIAIWVYRMSRHPRLGPNMDFNIADWALIAFAAITLLTTLISPFRELINIWVGIPEPHGRYDGTITQLFYVAIFFIISRWYKPRERDFMWFSIFAIAISLIGVFQFFGMDFFRLWPQHLPEHRLENFFNLHIRTTLGNTNTVSVFVTLAILFTGFLFIRKKSKWQPLWLAASGFSFWMWDIANADSGTVGVAFALLFCIPFIIQTLKTLGRTLILASTWAGLYTLQLFFFEVVTINTRQASSLLPFAGVFAILLASGILLSLKGKEPDPDSPPKWKLGVILIALCIIVGIVGVEILGRPDADGVGGGILYEAREILHGNIRDEFGTNRIFIWRNALSVVPNNPLIGTGPDTFFFAFPFEAHGGIGEVGEAYDNAHNEYIHYLVTHGILGLAAYLLFAFAIVAKSWRKAFGDPIIMATLAAFVGYLAQAFFNISHPIASQILWVFAGILMSRRLSDKGRFEDV